MESLGKEHNLKGEVVHQGMSVYGNKGSTDQHSYVQQLRDGVHNFFVTFIEVLQHRKQQGPVVEDAFDSGDFLTGLFLGTRDALYEKSRESITLTIDCVSPYTVGLLIGLYERVVGLYASLININAYHQPGVEAGKKAAKATLELQHSMLTWFQSNAGKAVTVEDLAQNIGVPEKTELVFKIVQHLVANPQHKLAKNARIPFNTSTYICQS